MAGKARGACCLSFAATLLTAGCGRSQLEPVSPPPPPGSGAGGSVAPEPPADAGADRPPADAGTDRPPDPCANRCDRDQSCVAALLDSTPSFAVPPDPEAVAVGDVNGDGALDLVVASLASQEVSLLAGHGDGTFATARSLWSGARSGQVAIAMADINQDGRLDLVVAAFAGSGADVLLGNGDGSFQPARTVALGSPVARLTVADLNGDRAPDLVTIDGTTTTTVNVLLGFGDGGFGPVQSFDAGGRASDLAVADLDGDGLPDLVASTLSTTLEFGLTTLRGNGDGTFGAPRTGIGLARSVADFDGDGTKDLAVAHLVANDVSVVPGNGDGSFGVAATAPAVCRRAPRSATPGASRSAPARNRWPPAISTATAEAFDSSGLPLPGNGVTVWLGKGDGSFRRAGFVPEPYPDFVVVRDLDHDGSFDVVAVSYTSAPNSWVDVLLGNGDGTLQTPRRFVTGDTSRSVAVGDLNGDGNLDLVVARTRPNDVVVLLGDGAGGFGPPRSFGGATAPKGPWSIALGDLDHDGDLDMVIGSSYSAGITVLLGNGDGSFGAPTVFGRISNPISVALADFDGDGTLDAAVNDITGSADVLLGNGDGSFRAPQAFAAGYAPSFVTTGDVIGDGRADLLVASIYVSGVDVLIGNRDGSFQPARFFTGASGVTSVAVADFDGDGRLDLALADADAASVTVLIGVDRHDCR